MNRVVGSNGFYGRGGLGIAVSLIFVSLIVLLGVGPAFSGPDGSLTGEEPRYLVFRADPDLKSSSVGAPAGFLEERARGLRTSKTQVRITYAPKGSTHGKYECGDWPQDAKKALSYATEIWAYYLRSTPAIRITSCWVVSGMDPTTLGSASEPDYRHDFKGAKQKNTWYTTALASSLHGTDVQPNKEDMYLSYNNQFPWYFGTDGKVPENKYDFISVVLHEIVHGLGFYGTANIVDGEGLWGKHDGALYYPDIWDRFIQNGKKESVIDTEIFPNPSKELAAQLTGNNLFFGGPNAVKANNNKPAKIAAPAAWDYSSSYSHLDEDTFAQSADSLMIPSIGPGQSKHSAGPVIRGMLTDLGWAITPYKLTAVIEGNKKGSVKAAGMVCGTDGTCTGGYQEGEKVDITATAASGSVFYGWTGCTSASGAVCHVTISKDVTVTATFNTRPSASVSPGSINFGAVDIAGPFTSKKITVTNKGTATLTITSVSATGPFGLKSNDCGSLDQGESCTIEVAPDPESETSFGTKTGTVLITSNDGSPDTVKLSVNFSPPVINVPVKLNFGTAYIGDSNTETLVIRNTGVSTLTFSKIALRNGNATLEVDSSACTSLARNGHCNISVAFTPVATGWVTDYLDITSNDPRYSGKVTTVTITGNGVEPTGESTKR